MGFDFTQQFASAAAHNPAGAFLQRGTHVVTIDKVEGSETSSGGYPQIDVFVSNGDGRQKDRLYISPREFAIAKIVGLVDAAGIRRPGEGDVSPTDGRLSPQYLNLLVGKRVSIVVRDEEDRNGEIDERTGQVKMWPRVQGYLPVAAVTQDAPADTVGLPEPGQQQFSSPADDDIPF